MDPRYRMSDALIAALLMVMCVVACSMACREARAEPMRVMDPPVVAYPQTREYALHGSTVELRFGSEVYEVSPTPDELRYGMRYSREP